MPFLALLVGIAYWPGIYGAPYLPRWWVIAIGLPLVSCLYVSALHPFVLWCTGLGLAWSALTLVWTPHLYGGGLQLILMLLLFGTMVAAAGCADINRVLYGLALGIAPSSLLAIGQYGWGVALVPQSTVPAGFFFSPPALAEVAAPLLVWGLWSRRFEIAALMAVPVLLCQSRIAWLAAGVGLLAGWRPERVWVRPALLVLLAVCGLAAIVVIKPESSDHRMVLWGAAIHSITLPGRGLGWWFSAHPFALEEYAHSDVLQALAETGWAGLCLLTAGVFAACRRGTHGAVHAAFIAACVGVCVSFPLHLPASGFLVAALAGALAVRRVDVCVWESQRRADQARGVRWLRAIAAGVARIVRPDGRGVSAEPGEPQPAGVRAPRG